MEVFQFARPASIEKPVLVEVPHAGLGIPDPVLGELRVDRDAVTRDADIFVDKLFADAPLAGAALLTANVSRYVVDLNRAPDDVDRATVSDHPAPRAIQPRGVVWRLSTDGTSVLPKPLTHKQLLTRLAQFYQPYHTVLGRELRRLRDSHGHVVLLAGHSMPSKGYGAGEVRADIVPGTRGRTTAASMLIDVVDHHFRAAGLTVRHDDPYRGGFTTAHYGRPREGVHAIQIELNRALYVDERTGEPLERQLHQLKGLLTDLVRKLGDVPAL